MTDNKYVKKFAEVLSRYCKNHEECDGCTFLNEKRRKCELLANPPCDWKLDTPSGVKG